MSRSADVCLYVLAVQTKLLPEPELDALLVKTGETGLSLKNLLTSRCDGEKLDALLRQRHHYAARCGACKLTTFVLPSQERRCEHCKGDLPPPGEAPAQEDEARVQAQQRAGKGLGADTAAPPVQPPATRPAPLPPPRPAGPAPPTPAEAALAVLRGVLDRLKEDARLVGALVGLILLAMVLFGFSRMLRRLPWHQSDSVSAQAARHHKRLRVVLVTNPVQPDCAKFWGRVMEDDRVLALKDDLVWQMDLATDKHARDRSDHVFGVPQGPSRLPWLLIYNEYAEVVDGMLGCRDMTCEEFLALLERCKQDPRSLESKLAQAR